MVNSILILAVIVLPGWISISAAQRYHPRVVERTALMVWGMMFYHAAIVHIIGVGAVAAAALVWPGYFLDTIDLDRVLTDGAAEFAQDSPGTAFAAFGAYFLWIVAGSAISGVVDLPFKLTSSIGWIANKLSLAPAPAREEPVWYSALDLDRIKSGKSSVQVSIRMKNGDLYIGELKRYPIAPDTVESKDIWLGKHTLYPNDNPLSPIEMDFDDGESGVLLNTANVSSVHYGFFDDYGDAGADAEGANNDQPQRKAARDGDANGADETGQAPDGRGAAGGG